MKIFLDYREKNLEKNLKNIKGVEVIVTNLEVGDIIIPDENVLFVFERKTATDFISSICDGRLFEQLSRTKDIKEIIRVYLIVGDFWKPLIFRKISKNSIAGAYNSLVFDWGVKILHAHSDNWAALLIRNFISRISKQMPDEEVIRLRKAANRKMTDNEKMIYILEGFSGIGPKTAVKLLEKYGSISEIFNNLDDVNMNRAIRESLSIVRKKYNERETG